MGAKVFVPVIKIFRVFEGLAAVALCVMTLITTYEVIMRYLFTMPSTWVFEISHYALVIVVTWGLANGLFVGVHITVDLVYERLSLQWRRRLDIVTSSVSVCMAAVYVWAIVDLVTLSRSRHEVSLTVLQIPQYLPQIGLLIGFLMFLFATLIVWRKSWRTWIVDGAESSDDKSKTEFIGE